MHSRVGFLLKVKILKDKPLAILINKRKKGRKLAERGRGTTGGKQRMKRRRWMKKRS